MCAKLNLEDNLISSIRRLGVPNIDHKAMPEQKSELLLIAPITQNTNKLHLERSLSPGE